MCTRGDSSAQNVQGIVDRYAALKLINHIPERIEYEVPSQHYDLEVLYRYKVRI